MKVSVTKEKLDALANAVSMKSGESIPLTIDEMATAVEGIQTGGTLQSKTATPTESSQTITPDQGYDGLSSVEVGAISSTYVGSGITRRTNSDLEADDGAVIVPAGYYDEQASKAVDGTTYTAPTISVNSSTGLITATHVQNIGYTWYADYIRGDSTTTATQQLTTKSATTYNTSTTDQTISSGQYLTGTQTIKAVTVSGLSADKILSGTTVKVGDANDDDRITSVTGTVTFSTIYTGSSDPSSSTGSNGDIYLKVVS